MKKALIIGGTGTISKSITEALAADPEWELTLLNRGNNTAALPDGVRLIRADIKDETDVSKALNDSSFNCVCDFIAYKREDVESAYRLFRGRTAQFILISSASAYDKHEGVNLITENTPLCNPFWQYSRDKIACEEALRDKPDFPFTIVRPSHTYAERKAPVAVHGKKGSWQVLRRMLEGKPVPVPDDGLSLWTLTHSSDFAKGFIPLMGNQATLGEAYHITSAESLTWDGIYEATARALGVDPVLCHIPSSVLAQEGRQFGLEGTLLGDKARSVIFDNSKIRTIAPHFEARVKFADGIRSTVEYILSHEDCRIPDPEFDAWCDAISR